MEYQNETIFYSSGMQHPHQSCKDDSTSCKSFYNRLTTSHSYSVLQNCPKKLSNSSKTRPVCTKPSVLSSSRGFGLVISSNKCKASEFFSGSDRIKMPLSNGQTVNNGANYNQKLEYISYAGSRFHRPPKPNALPKPPSHWVESNLPALNHVCNNDPLDTIAVQLKGMLKVQA